MEIDTNPAAMPMSLALARAAPGGASAKTNLWAATKTRGLVSFTDDGLHGGLRQTGEAAAGADRCVAGAPAGAGVLKI